MIHVNVMAEENFCCYRESNLGRPVCLITGHARCKTTFLAKTNLETGKELMFYHVHFFSHTKLIEHFTLETWYE